MNKEAEFGHFHKNIYIFNVYVLMKSIEKYEEKYNFKLKWLEELSKIIEKYFILLKILL